jgi:hypothetical protein
VLFQQLFEFFGSLPLALELLAEGVGFGGPYIRSQRRPLRRRSRRCARNEPPVAVLYSFARSRLCRIFLTFVDFASLMFALLFLVERFSGARLVFTGIYRSRCSMIFPPIRRIILFD